MLKTKYAAMFTDGFMINTKQAIEQRDLTKFVRLFLTLFKSIENENKEVTIGFPFNFYKPVYYFKGASNLFEFEDERNLERQSYSLELTGLSSNELAEIFHEASKVNHIFKDGNDYYKLGFDYNLPNMDKYVNPRLERVDVREIQ